MKYHLTFSSWTFYLLHMCNHFHSSRRLAGKGAWPSNISLHHGVRFEISPLALNSIYFTNSRERALRVLQQIVKVILNCLFQTIKSPHHCGCGTDRRKKILFIPSFWHITLHWEAGLVTLFRSRGGVTPYKGLYWVALPGSGIFSVRRVYIRVRVTPRGVGARWKFWFAML